MAAERGFSLLEALVALVLIGLALIPFLTTLSAGTYSANRIAEEILAADKALNALEVARLVNPADSPEGSIDLGAYALSWESEELEALRPGAGYPRGIGLYDIGLWAVSIRDPQSEADEPLIRVRRAGYVKERQPNVFGLGEDR